MRKLSELYKIVLEKFLEKKYIYEPNIHYRCICFTISGINLGSGEERTLFINLVRNYPTIFSKFYWNKSFKPRNKYGYWWNGTEEGYNQRVLFLKHLIKKYESTGN